MPLREYQQEAVHRLRAAIKKHGSAVYVLPTGGGKTVVAGEIARRAAAKGSRTLFLVHRRELVKQAVDTLLEAVPGVSIGVECSGWPKMPWAPLQVGMVQSVARREHVAKPDLVIIDEAHHARAKTWETVLGRWPNARRIGLTATPERLDGKGLGQHFGDIVLGPTIPELVAIGSLAPCRTLRIPSSLSLEGIGTNRQGEYRADELGERITGGVIADAVRAYQRYANGRPAIFFGVHREHSRSVCRGLQEIGVRAEHVDGDDPPARRDRIMQSLRTGGVDVVGNCDLIAEGYDAPRCDVVLLGCPTRSVTRYLQQAGRAMRPGEGKTALILDLAGISHELGLPDEVRQWSLEDGEMREPKKAHQRPRDCPQCLTVFYGPRCPACGEMQEAMAVPEVETELEEAIAGPPKRNGNRRADLWRDVAIAKKAADPRRALLAVAQQRGYKPGWANHILRAWGYAA